MSVHKIGNTTIKVIHVMKDGSVRDSIEGVVIPNEEFYQAWRGVLEWKEEQRKKERMQSENQNMAHLGSVGSSTDRRNNRCS